MTAYIFIPLVSYQQQNLAFTPIIEPTQNPAFNLEPKINCRKKRNRKHPECQTQKKLQKQEELLIKKRRERRRTTRTFFRDMISSMENLQNKVYRQAEYLNDLRQMVIQSNHQNQMYQDLLIKDRDRYPIEEDSDDI